MKQNSEGYANTTRKKLIKHLTLRRNYSDAYNDQSIDITTSPI